MLKYGYRVIWTHRKEGRFSYSITNCDSREDARHEALVRMEELGWTPPKWWQWWRWGDTK